MRNAARQIASVRNFVSSSASHHGRAAAFRRQLIQPAAHSQYNLSSTTIQSPSSQVLTPLTFPATVRSLHTYRPFYQQAQPKEDVKDPPRPEEQEAKSEESAKTDKEGQSSGQEEGEKKEGEQDGKKDEPPPPPPPHGDKTPWQVFTQTLRTEFKASQEWNDSTKQLAGQVQDFRESESVQKARRAYEATAGPAAQAVKATGKAIGQGAAWTWDTGVVQGVRKGVNATGRGIEKATRPVRETQAFKEVTKALDDGSSSRYGGWTEKEERKRRREQQDLKDQVSGKRTEKIEEDPK